MYKNVGEKNFKKLAWGGLILIVVATALLSAFIPRLRFDYDFEKFFPSGDDETTFFLEHRNKFRSDNDFLLIAIENKNGSVFDSTFLVEVDDFVKKLEKSSPHIERIISITNMEEVLIFPGNLSSRRPYIDWTEPDLKRDSLRIFRSKELVDVLIANDARSLSLFLKHEDYLSKKKSDELLETVEKTSSMYDFERVRIAGRVIGQKYYITVMMQELLLFVGLSAFLIVLFLYIAFRSGWGIILPQLVIVSSVLWLLGLMGVFNEPINIILTTIPMIMFVVGMSDVIHLVSRYLDALRTGVSKFDAINISLREVGFATLLTSVTTAIGFFTLVFVRVEPIQKFGVVLGIGVLIAFLLTFLLLPFLFYLAPSPKYIYKKKDQHFWYAHLRKWFIWIMRNKKKTVTFYIALLLIFLWGISMIRTNNYLMDDLRASEPLKQDFNYLDDHYGGVRPFELAVQLKDSSASFWDQEVLNELQEVENYLEKSYGVTLKSTLVQTIKVMNRSSHSGNPEYFALPESQAKLKSIRRMVRIANAGELYNALVDTTGMTMRINGTIPDWGNEKVTNKNKELLNFLTERKNPNLDFKITGTAHLIDKNMRYLSKSLVQGLAFSILIVALIMGLIYRSVSMMLISIVPNIFPLIAVAGIMGFFGIELKISTAIVFTIAFGIAVDDTIHLLGKFKFELMKGRSVMYAMKRAYLTTGKAMILTSLILCSGFLLLVFSSFMGSVYMGILLCVTLLFALIADLTLLPILIVLFYRPGKKKKPREL
jgi:predicted RND superfamily exporter protein